MRRTVMRVGGTAEAEPSRPDRPTSNRDEGIDDTLIDLMLAQTISDRLRSLSNYVTALGRFRRV
jgi:hypothetical protein